MISVGVDIEDVSRFNLNQEKNQHFLSTVFTPSEIAFCYNKKNPSQHLAARFCVKEATRKALSQADLQLPAFDEIEVMNSQPKGIQVTLHNENFSRIHIQASLSYSRDMAIATAFAFEDIR